MTRALIIVAALAACTGDKFLTVTVNSHPTVHGAAALQVTLGNAGASRMDTRTLGMNQFPVTFTVSAPGRSGDLDIKVDALDSNNILVGHGEVTTPLSADTTTVMLDGTDFVVNTDYAGDQFLTDDYEAIGLQLAASSDGTWMAGFRDSCNMSNQCNIFGRRFDANGIAVTSAVAAGTNAFPITTTLTQSTSTAAVAAAGGKTLVFWDYADTVGTGTGVACRAIDSAGNALPGQLSLAAESADVVTATALSNLNFAVTWQVFGTSYTVHTIIVRPDCTPITAVQTLSTDLGTSSGALRSHVAANSGSVLYAWIVEVTNDFGGDVHIRTSDNSGTFGTAMDIPLLMHTTDLEIDFVRVMPLGTGYGMVVRWSSPSGTGTAGKIELYRLSSGGQLQGNPTLIADQTGSDFTSDQSIGVATRGDGAMMIVWHQCMSGGVGCEVFGRVVRPTGVPVGAAFVLSTSTSGEQTNPSVAALPMAFVAAWNDSSKLAPDGDSLAVHARILGPVYDDAASIQGALCGGSKPACGMGLVCAMGTDNAQRCYEKCVPGPPGTCPDGGTCDAGTQACTY